MSQYGITSISDLKIIHILHHSLSSFTGQFPDKDLLHYDGGFSVQFAKEIRKRCPEAEMECWRPERTLHQEYFWQDEDYQIKHCLFPSTSLRYGWELSLSMLRTAQRFARSGGSKFIIHGSYNLHTYLLARLLENTPAIVQSHGGLPAKARVHFQQKDWFKPLFVPLAQFERVTLAHYPHIFAVSRLEKNALEKSFPGLPVSFSPMSIDFDHFSPGDKQISRIRVGLATEARIILFVGRLVLEKGIQYLLEAATHLRKRYSNLELHLLGSGPAKQDLQQQAKSLGIEESIIFGGYIDHASLVDWYRAADVVCLPSHFEPFGLAIAEALACGTPVVGSAVGGIMDIVQEFQCGELVPPRSARDLALAIERVLDGSANTTPDIENARHKFSWSSKLQHTFELLNTMSQEKPKH